MPRVTSQDTTKSDSRGTSRLDGPRRFDGLSIRQESDGTTVIHGSVVDQAALHGLLTRVRDLGLPLISVTQIDPQPTKGTQR